VVKSVKSLSLTVAYVCLRRKTAVFQGASSLSLDAKGRLSVPTRHRDVLSATAGGQLTITRHPHGCLMVFPRTEWEKFRERIAALPMSAQWWKRVLLGNAMDVEMDGTGRVLISPELRAAAGISKDTMLLGMGTTSSCGTKPLTKRKKRKPCKVKCRTSSRNFLSKG
jgi:MraZ protein